MMDGIRELNPEQRGLLQTVLSLRVGPDSEFPVIRDLILLISSAGMQTPYRRERIVIAAEHWCSGCDAWISPSDAIVCDDCGIATCCPKHSDLLTTVDGEHYCDDCCRAYLAESEDDAN